MACRSSILSLGIAAGWADSKLFKPCTCSSTVSDGSLMVRIGPCQDNKNQKTDFWNLFATQKGSDPGSNALETVYESPGHRIYFFLRITIFGPAFAR